MFITIYYLKEKILKSKYIILTIPKYKHYPYHNLDLIKIDLIYSFFESITTNCLNCVDKCWRAMSSSQRIYSHR